MNISKARILILTEGSFDQASARIRAILYIPYFEKEGFRVCHIPRVPRCPTTLPGKYFSFPIIKRYLWLKRHFVLLTGRWDIIFIQRLFVSEQVMRWINRKALVIYDFDDAVYLPEDSGKRARKAAVMIRYAHRIIVSTPYLNQFTERYGKKAGIIPSPVETERIFPRIVESPRRIPVIGWIGSYWTTGYLRIVETVLQKLAGEFQFTFLTAGSDPDYIIPSISHVIRKWTFETENSLINEMDIGIMPLPDDEYARSKGAYKLYLYMAGGIPVVASPVGINSSVVTSGRNGFLAATDEEWEEALRTLVINNELRKKMGEEGRKDAVALYDRKVCFTSLMEIIREAWKQK